MEYSFNTDMARKYGVCEAIMIRHLQYWLMKNKANEQNFHDDHYWTYNTIKAFGTIFDFWTEKQIRRILDNLIEKGILITGNYNSQPWDRTLWYAFKDECIFLSGQMGATRQETPFAQTGKSSITDNKPDNKPDNKHVPFVESEILNYLNIKTGSSFKITTKSNISSIKARIEEGYSVDEIKKMIDYKVAEWTNTEFEKYLCPSTLFRPANFEKYIHQSRKPFQKREETPDEYVNRILGGKAK